MEKLERVARRVAADLREALGVGTEVIVYGGEEKLQARRRLAAKELPQEWDVLVCEQALQAADARPQTPRAASSLVGATVEWRAGPVVPEFDSLYEQLRRGRSS